MSLNVFPRLTALTALALSTALLGCSNDDDEPHGLMWVSVVDDEGPGVGPCSLRFTEEDTGGGCGQGFRDGSIDLNYKIIADGVARITILGGVPINTPSSEIYERVYEESFAIEGKVEETPFTYFGHPVRLRVEGAGKIKPGAIPLPPSSLR